MKKLYTPPVITIISCEKMNDEERFFYNLVVNKVQSALKDKVTQIN